MAVKAPRKLHRRQQSTTPLIVTNRCSDTIWPGISTQAGDGPPDMGFELQPGSSRSQTVSEDWQGRVWGRTNCSFNDAGTGPANGRRKACGSGDCYGVLQCVVGGDVPVSLAEMTLDAGDGHTYYDISLVDGYNLPIAIDPYSGSDPNFLSTNSSFQLPFDQSVTSDECARWCPWDLQEQPPDESSSGVVTYPDDQVQRPGFNPCFSACAKWNKDSDCCTGPFNSPTKCQPGDYSKNAKKVCPDAYSFAYDDQTSTFIIPAGAGFEVIFCPGGRSTTILSTYIDEMLQLAQTGKVDHMGRRSLHKKGVGEQKQIATVRKSGARKKFRIRSVALMAILVAAAYAVAHAVMSWS
ncbi:Osmotin, thaumatin-like protein [Sporormia fimetaria CBS 119925]|uniref:Osmotin, thaumatin-like protein n=1 Tax=Sporormia fimetaria CBS 119925 TaxID=1340428 RepID=A0A6A6VHD5_9PLEO|nr:Osmotin, thaumatin-like protein [Sporormia fimetaria CBS 119925]